MVPLMCGDCGRWAASRGERGLVSTNAGYGLIPVWPDCAASPRTHDKRSDLSLPAITEVPIRATSSVTRSTQDFTAFYPARITRPRSPAGARRHGTAQKAAAKSPRPVSLGEIAKHFKLRRYAVKWEADQKSAHARGAWINPTDKTTVSVGAGAVLAGRMLDRASAVARSA
jgi:hypothetical protein